MDFALFFRCIKFYFSPATTGQIGSLCFLVFVLVCQIGAKLGLLFSS